MKALILVGGFGTRLRPLTFTKAKPLVEFCNLPIVFHQLAALAEVGVKEVILAVSYKPQQMVDAIPFIKEKYGINIIISVEDIPMGTAGPLALAQKYLENEDMFFVFNSDVSCSYPLQKLIDFHKAHGKEGTIVVTQVKDPSHYGVVVAEDDGQIRCFVEKPKEYVGNHINAGIYLFNPSILKRIPNQPTSIERVIFPKMASENQLYRMVLDGFWMDIGQPKDYLIGTGLYLNSIRNKVNSIHDSRFLEGKNIEGNVLVHTSVSIDASVTLGPDVVIGENVVIGKNCDIKYSSILSGTVIGDNCTIEHSIIGWNNKIKDNCHISRCYTGDDVTVKEGIELNDYNILPNKCVSESNPEVKRVIM